MEERRRMRWERAQQRVQKQAQRRKLFLRLGLAGVILIASIVLIFLLTRKEPSPSASDPTAQSTEAAPTGQTQAPTDVTQAADPNTTVIHYAAAGDLNINESTVASGGGSYNYTQTFLDVAHLLADADIASVNFEGNLCGEPYGSNFSAPQTMANALQKAGVDLVQMANSYSINRGLSGLSSSISAIRSAGMEPLGVYASNEDFAQHRGYTIRIVKGIKLAFVAFTKGMDGMALPPGSESCVNLLYTDYDSAYKEIDKERIGSIMTAVNKEEPDIIIALLHWGSEYNNTISKSQSEIVSLLQAYGTDAIIGTHSHYVQKMTFDADKGQFVAYSLGDFFSDAQRAGSEYSVILDLEISKDKTTGIAKITGYSYTPIFTVSEEDQPLRVVRITPAMAAYEGGYLQRVSPETYEKMRYAMERIPVRIAGE